MCRRTNTVVNSRDIRTDKWLTVTIWGQTSLYMPFMSKTFSRAEGYLWSPSEDVLCQELTFYHIHFLEGFSGKRVLKRESHNFWLYHSYITGKDPLGWFYSEPYILKSSSICKIDWLWCQAPRPKLPPSLTLPHISLLKIIPKSEHQEYPFTK